MLATAKPPRKLSKAARRQQLLEATIAVLAKRGFARATLTDVAIEAGLSHGLVNFHFHTKEKLLSETLEFLAAEYRRNWTAALADAPSDPAAQLNAMLRADFASTIFSPERVAAWCSFWGEAQSRPMYQQTCGAYDAAYNEVLEEIVTQLVRQGGYGNDPSLAARVLRVTVEGVWLEMMVATEPYDLVQGLRTVYACAQAFFPDHFNLMGLK